MALSKHFSHHAHSGRKLPHHHTSYFGLSLVIILFGLVLCSTTSARVNALTLNESGSVGVSGTVYGSPPTTPAVITVPTNGTTINSNITTVSGTCGAGLIVKIFRNEILAGSTVCSSGGTFNLQISLLTGQNVLRARNYDFQDQAGPNSPDVIIFSNIVVANSPSPSVKSTPVKNSLIISSKYSHKSIDQNFGFEWPFEISGGLPPYAVLIDWGDGETSLLSIEQIGSFSAKHKYKNTGTYKIIVKVTDAAGNQAMIEVVANAQGVSVMPQLTEPPRFYDQVWPLLLAWPLYGFVTALLLSFWLGEKYAKHRILKLNHL